MKGKLVLSVIVPAFNEERTIERVIEKLKNLKINGGKEIIVVDDGSLDSTPEILRKLKGIKVVTHRSNLGKGAAVEMGLNHAQGEYVIVQDADLEYNPDEIPLLLREAGTRKLLAVYGSRDSKIKNYYRYPLFYWGSKMLAGMINMLFRQKLSDPETCYKLVNTDLLKFLGLESPGFGIEIEISAKLSRLGIEIGEVPITYNPRTFAEGKKIGVKDGVEAVWLVWKYFAADLHYWLVDRYLRWMREQELLGSTVFNEGTRVLDVGCGRQAHLGWKLRTRVGEYVGVDRDVPKVRLGNLRLENWNVEKLPTIGKFDRIVGLAILEHLNDAEQFVRRSRQLLKPKGELILTTPIPASDKVLKMAAGIGLIDGSEIKDHKRYFSMNDLCELLTHNGFVVTRARRFAWGFNSLVVAS